MARARGPVIMLISMKIWAAWQEAWQHGHNPGRASPANLALVDSGGIEVIPCHASGHFRLVVSFQTWGRDAPLRQLHIAIFVFAALLIAALITVHEDDRKARSILREDFRQSAQQLRQSVHASENAANRVLQNAQASEEATDRRQTDINRRLDNLAQVLPAMRESELASEREITRLNERLAALSFSLGVKGSPADINLGALDTYESLDQNWQSFRDVSQKMASDCRIVGERSRTAVIITLGQSNAANHGLGNHVASGQVDNFNLYDGHCYHAADPLLGASGAGGNFATRLGDILIQRGRFDRVILAPIAQGGTTVEQWADEGMFNRRIMAIIRRLYDAHLTPDFILWHQGEGNLGVGDSEGRQYRKNLLEVVRTFREFGIDTPFYIALTTRCGTPRPNAVNIRAGQRGAVDIKIHTFLGPDTDLLGPEFRDPQICHFNEAGLVRHAEMWADALSALGADSMKSAELKIEPQHD